LLVVSQVERWPEDRAMHSISRPLTNLVLPLLAAVFAYLFGTSRAWSEPARRGGQWEILAGATACVDARASCEIDRSAISGQTLPSFGGGVSLGWRVNRWLQLGGAYRFGMFQPDFDVTAGESFDWAYQHSIFAFVRPTIPIWRVDLGLDLGPGFSRQVFRRSWESYDASQGFSFLIGPAVDIYLTDTFFIGAKVDILLNAHDEVCARGAGTRSCASPGSDDVAPVHQVIYGVHIGGNFGL
jgi:hypothetical protein